MNFEEKSLVCRSEVLENIENVDLKVKVMMCDSKLGKIPYVNLPSIFTCDRRIGCCSRKECYGTRGNLAYSQSLKSSWVNFYSYINDRDKFFDDIVSQIECPTLTYKYFRWFAIGDIVDYNFLLGIVYVANKCKNTKFLCFTKKYEIVNEYLDKGGVIPKNLNIVFSHWDKDNIYFNNPHNLPTTYVYFKDEKRNVEIPKNAKECLGDCMNCTRCWVIKKGESVVFNKH